MAAISISVGGDILIKIWGGARGGCYYIPRDDGMTHFGENRKRVGGVDDRWLAWGSSTGRVHYECQKYCLRYER